MPARRKEIEPHTPPNTPPKTRTKRNGSGSSFGSLSSSNSQRFTVYLKERPSASSSVYSSLDDNPFLREEELYGQIKLANSQPTLSNLMDSDLEDDFMNQSAPLPTVIDRSISDIQRNNDTITNSNNNNDNPGFLKRGLNFLIGLLAKSLNFIGFTIFFICWCIKNCIDFIWSNLNVPFSDSTTTSTTTTTNNVNNIINNKKGRWLTYLLLFVIFVLLLLLSSRGDENRARLIDYIPLHDKVNIWPLGRTTYKIQPIEKNNGNEILRGDDGINDSFVFSWEDFKQLIISEIRKYMKAGDDELLRSVVMEELKSILSKKGINLRPDHLRDSRLYRSLKGEEMLEIIRKEARTVAKDELLKYSQDKLNRPDFALHSGGAKVISKFTSKTYEVWPDKWYRKAFASLSGRGIIRGKPPVTAIQDETNVGQCWPFSGQDGQLAVMLSRRVYVTAVTYDHVSKDISVDIYSAPKQFEVWGLVDEGTDGRIKDEDEDLDLGTYDMESTEEKCGTREDGNYVPGKNNNIPGSNSANNANGGNGGLSYWRPKENLTKGELDLGSSSLHVFLGRFTYDIRGLPVQTFEIPPNLRVNKPIRTVIMRVNSNWGKPEYTCLYRFRVHGEPADKAEADN